ncbi:MAG: hypothetical protein OEY99_06470, partial [Aigarchaeota archaeon]|nr:hypothetical protein [Aigarchaeota archaeon]
ESNISSLNSKILATDTRFGTLLTVPIGSRDRDILVFLFVEPFAVNHGQGRSSKGYGVSDKVRQVVHK